MLHVYLHTVVVRVVAGFQNIDRAITAERSDLIELRWRRSQRRAWSHAQSCNHARILQRGTP